MRRKADPTQEYKDPIVKDLFNRNIGHEIRMG